MLKEICNAIKSLNNKIKATTLYENIAGSDTNITLNQNAKNFSRIKIYSKSKLTNNEIVAAEFDANVTNFSLSGMEYNNDTNRSRNYCTNYKILNNQISIIASVFFTRDYSSGAITGEQGNNNIKIYKVEAYK